MWKSSVLVLVLVFLITSCIIVAKPALSSDEITENYWLERAPMHMARGRLGTAVVDGKIYAIGGDNGSEIGGGSDYIATGTGALVNTNEEYDPSTDVWTIRAPMPTPRDHFGVAVYQNKIYCMGGQMRNSSGVYATGANEVYDPSTDTWETKTPMPIPGRFQMANVVIGKIYLIGSIDPNSQNQVYDPSSDSWTIKIPPPNNIWSCGSVKIDDELYFIGSSDQVWPEVFIETYNPANDSWSEGPKAPLNGAIDTMVGTVGITTGMTAPQKLYFFDNNLTYVYSPENNSWSAAASMPRARGYAGVAVVNDSLYVVGGENLPTIGFGLVSPSSINEQYIPFGYGTISPPHTTEGFPILSIAAISLALTVVMVALLLVYFRKRKLQGLFSRCRLL